MYYQYLDFILYYGTGTSTVQRSFQKFLVIVTESDKKLQR